MKNIIKLLSLVLICSFALSINNADAQTRKKKSNKVDEYFDDQGTIIERLWYGADVSFNFIPLPGFGNIIAYGISPMAGVKINDWFSVGPRIQFSVLNGRVNRDIPIPDGFSRKFNAVTLGAGLFARAKLGRTYFAHVEFDRISYSNPANGQLTFNDQGKIDLARIGQSHFYVGGGYNNQISETWSIQFTVLFDTLVDRDTWQQALPIASRFGVNYKF